MTGLLSWQAMSMWSRAACSGSHVRLVHMRRLLGQWALLKGRRVARGWPADLRLLFLGMRMWLSQPVLASVVRVQWPVVFAGLVWVHRPMVLACWRDEKLGIMACWCKFILGLLGPRVHPLRLLAGSPRIRLWLLWMRDNRPDCER